LNETILAAGDTVAPADLHATMQAAFADYLIGPLEITPAQWPNFLERQGVDLGESRVALREGRPVAFVLTARRPELARWRLAVMGAVPEARGSGAAQALLDDFIARARARGVQALELECFEKNERALRLYRSRGFKAVHALNGWTLPAGRLGGPPAPAVAPRAVDRAAGLAWLDDAVLRIPDLPLAVTRTSLAPNPRPLSFRQHGGAQLVFSVVEGTPIHLHSLVDSGAGQADASALVAALRAAHPGQVITVPPLQRDDLGGAALKAAGFDPQAMNQVLLVRPVD
jgi:ribosomal protein S18 acetylase RimI-like enzyme